MGLEGGKGGHPFRAWVHVGHVTQALPWACLVCRVGVWEVWCGMTQCSIMLQKGLFPWGSSRRARDLNTFSLFLFYLNFGSCFRKVHMFKMIRNGRQYLKLAGYHEDLEH